MYWALCNSCLDIGFPFSEPLTVSGYFVSLWGCVFCEDDLICIFPINCSQAASSQKRTGNGILSPLDLCIIRSSLKCARGKICLTAACTLFSLWLHKRTSVSRDIITATFTDTKYVHTQLVYWRKSYKENKANLGILVWFLDPNVETSHSPRLGKKFRFCIPFSFVNHNWHLEGYAAL